MKSGLIKQNLKSAKLDFIFVSGSLRRPLRSIVVTVPSSAREAEAGGLPG